MAEPATVLIVGAAGTIGRAAAALLSSQGYPLILADQDDASLQALARSLPHATAVCADALDAQAMAALFDAAAPKLGAVVLAVGCEGPVGPLETCADAEFQRAMALNVTSVWNGLKYGLKALKPKGTGSIVVVSSISGLMAAPMMSAYAAGKHAVMGLVRSAAREAAGSGVRVNAVCPGPAVSEMMERIDGGLGRASAAASVPLQRYADPAEIAEMIAFLCSDASRYSTGSSFVVDGGYSCR